MSEAIVSQKVARRFNNCEIGDTLHFGSAQWTVVGHFSAEGTAPDSEVWTDVQGLLSTFKRDLYSSILVRTPDRAARDEMIAAINADPRLTLDTRNERAYYDDQTVTSKPIQFLGMLVGVIMAIGACFGAMNTMYAAVAARAREVATLRVLGFSKPAILLSFATESVILSLAGGILGCLMGYAAIRTVLSGVSGTMNFVTFSEVVFTFDLNPGLVAQAMLFALLMGVLGGLFPAARAARTEITAALRQVA
jgi:putative ABC transport system permease protein